VGIRYRQPHGDRKMAAVGRSPDLRGFTVLAPPVRERAMPVGHVPASRPTVRGRVPRDLPVTFYHGPTTAENPIAPW